MSNDTIIQALQKIAPAHGIGYELFSGNWIARMHKDGQTRFLCGFEFDVNTSVSVAIAKDKVATYLLLANQGISVVPHYLLKSIVDTRAEMATLKELLKNPQGVVIKPLQGSKGERIALITAMQAAVRLMQSDPSIGWAGSPFIDIAYELRLVMYKGQLMLAYKKTNPVMYNGLKMFNLGLGANSEYMPREHVPAAIVETAQQAVQALGLSFAAVDIVVDASGIHKVLELNTGFSLERFAHTNQANHAKVVSLYATVIKDLFR